MHCQVCHVKEGHDSALLGALEKAATRWLKFADVYLLYLKDSWPLPERMPENVTLRDRYRVTLAEDDRLYLVTQRMGCFNRLSLNVTVVFDRGRHLVVAVSENEAEQVAAAEPTLGLEPVTDNEIVVELCPCPPQVSKDPKIEALVDQVSRVSIKSYVTALTSYPTRRASTPYFWQAAEWAKTILEKANYKTESMDFRVPPKDGAPEGRSCNIIARRDPPPDSERTILVVGHLDSINDDVPKDDLLAPAPGADDNASGSAGVLELARILSKVECEHDLRFVLFGGEERGLLGSKAYLSRLSVKEISRIDAVVNMDMIGSLNPGSRRRGVLLESKPFANALVAELTEAAQTYSDLAVETSMKPWGSDHVSFLAEGIPAVLTIEGNDGNNPNYHSATDIADYIDYNLMQQILRMNIAFVAGRAGFREN